MQRPDKTNSPIDTNRTSIAGYFSRVMINKQKGDFYLNAALGLISPGFEYNDLGSQWMADRINGHLVLGYRWFEPDGIFRRKIFTWHTIELLILKIMLVEMVFMQQQVQSLQTIGELI